MSSPLPAYATTNIGSVPHTEPGEITGLILRTLDIPAWPQLPRLTFHENMYTQFSAMLPALTLDEGKEKIYFNTGVDLSQDITAFYEKVISDDVDSFAPPEHYASGFYALMDLLPPAGEGWIKGQVTGPISFGLTVTDQDLRSSLYHEMLADVIVKNTVMSARWQIGELRKLRPNVMIFVDEPYMASFGSAFISLSREQVVQMLDEVFLAIHEAGAIAGIHCCANTDWSVLLATQVDILNLDAHGFINNLALYPDELHSFFQRGGRIAWGMVPNHDILTTSTADQLATDLLEGIKQIVQRAADRGITIPADLAPVSMLTSNCGLGSSSIEIAEQVIETLAATALVLRRMTPA